MATKIEKFKEMGALLQEYFIFSKRFYGHEFKLADITPQQGRTLMFIADHPGIIQREIADIFHLRNASVTNMMKNLERGGYIERRPDPKSARNKLIYVTDSGMKQVNAMKQETENVLKKLSDRIDEKLLDQLIPLLKEYNKQIQKNKLGS